MAKVWRQTVRQMSKFHMEQHPEHLVLEVFMFLTLSAMHGNQKTSIILLGFELTTSDSLRERMSYPLGHLGEELNLV